MLKGLGDKGGFAGQAHGGDGDQGPSASGKDFKGTEVYLTGPKEGVQKDLDTGRTEQFKD